MPAFERAFRQNARKKCGHRRKEYLRYSYRSATTGSSFAALFAGQIPKNNPTPTDTTMPSTADHNGTVAGSESKTSLVMREMIQPKMIPAMPPRAVKADASSRN